MYTVNILPDYCAYPVCILYSFCQNIVLILPVYCTYPVSHDLAASGVLPQPHILPDRQTPRHHPHLWFVHLLPQHLRQLHHLAATLQKQRLRHSIRGQDLSPRWERILSENIITVYSLTFTCSWHCRSWCIIDVESFQLKAHTVCYFYFLCLAGETLRSSIRRYRWLPVQLVKPRTPRSSWESAHGEGTRRKTHKLNPI